MSAMITAPADAAHNAWTPGGTVTIGDGWVFFPTSRDCIAPENTWAYPVQAAAKFAAKAVRATGHNAWAAAGPNGRRFGLYVATR